MSTRLVLFHAFDPRSSKVGGVENHVRQVLLRRPPDFRVLMVGVDDRGDLELGKLHSISFAGREFDFLPVANMAADRMAAQGVTSSAAFRFVGGALKHLARLRGMIRGEAAVAEVERFEFAPLGRLLGCPTIVMAHHELDPRTEKSGSTLSRHWYLGAGAEWLALRVAARVFCVTPQLRDRLAGRHPDQARKMAVLPAPVDTDVFRPAPFDLSDGVLRLVYSGRLDEFEDPDLMLRVAQGLYEALDGAFEFHFCSGADPACFAKFAAVEPYLVRHGALLPEASAAVLRRAHMGFVLSDGNSVPSFLLETLASGRPAVGLRRPQYEALVTPDGAGRMVERGGGPEQTALRIRDAILQQWTDIRAGTTDQAAMHQKVFPLSAATQLDRLFAVLRQTAEPGNPHRPAAYSERV